MKIMNIVAFNFKNGNAFAPFSPSAAQLSAINEMKERNPSLNVLGWGYMSDGSISINTSWNFAADEFCKTSMDVEGNIYGHGMGPFPIGMLNL
jgi:hypothetical protein